MTWFLLLITATLSFSQVQVFPTRVTLTDQQTSSYINLKNPSSAPETYRIELVLFKMKSDGTFSKMETVPAGHVLADKIKYSPSTVTLPAGDKQVVRVMVLRMADVPEGEHYLYLRAIPEKSEETKTTGEGRTGFHLNARVAVAIPIVVRRGKVEALPQISQAQARSVKDGAVQLKFDLAKTGAGFVYGDLEVFAQSGEMKTLVSNVKGVTSYIDKRSYSLTLPALSLREAGVIGAVDSWSYVFKSNSESSSAFELAGLYEIATAASPAKKKPKKSN